MNYDNNYYHTVRKHNPEYKEYQRKYQRKYRELHRNTTAHIQRDLTQVPKKYIGLISIATAVRYRCNKCAKLLSHCALYNHFKTKFHLQF